MTAYFEQSSVLLRFPDHGKFALLCSLLSYWDERGRRHICGGEMPMPTDGMSIPRFSGAAMGLEPFRNPFLRACILHDHYCYKAAALPVHSQERYELRLAGDNLFMEMCYVCVPDDWRIPVMYNGVRVGAYAAQNDPAVPDYEHDPDAFWFHYLRANDLPISARP